MSKKFIQFLFWGLIITLIPFGSNGNASQSLKEACPMGEDIIGWNQEVDISMGWLFDSKYCIWTHSIHKGGIPIFASGYIKNDPTHTLFLGENLSVNNNGWKTTTQATGGVDSKSCVESAYVYFSLIKKQTTYEGSKITSCTYFICNSAISCNDPDADCRSSSCWSPDGEPTITLKPVKHKVGYLMASERKLI